MKNSTGEGEGAKGEDGLGRTMGLKQIGDKKEEVRSLYILRQRFSIFFHGLGTPVSPRMGGLDSGITSKNCCHQPNLAKRSLNDNMAQMQCQDLSKSTISYLKKWSILLRSTLRYLAVSNVTDMKAQNHKKKNKRKILKGKSSFCFARNY